MGSDAPLFEVYCDINARMTERGFLLTNGSIEDLARLGLTLEAAVGKRFAFNGGGDTDESGAPADIMFDGVVEHDPEWGYLAVMDAKGVYWRPSKS